MSNKLIALKDLDDLLCKYEVKDLEDLENRFKSVFDLEAKLAESERENKELHTAINLSIPNQIAMKDEIERLHTCVDKRIGELCEENNQLKQQLAEKEKQIEEVKKWWSYQFNREINTYLQDKISFCIEQLEKVQSYLKEKNENETWHNKVADEERDDIAEYIDNQIKQLKEGK